MLDSYPQKIIVLMAILLTSTTALPSWGITQRGNLNSDGKVLLTQKEFRGFSQRYGVAPRRRSKPFRRGSCLASETEMTALFPREDVITESDNQENLGKDRTWFTSEAYPTLYFHIPENSALIAEVVIEDSDRNIVYSALVSLPDQQISQTNPRQQGFIGIDFSQKAQELNIPALEPNQNYLWEVQLICNNLDRSGNPLVTGWITRINQDENERINQLITQENSREIPWIYAQEGIWYSTLNALAHNYIINSDTEQWATFLDFMGYHGIANDPLIGMGEVQEIFLGDLPEVEF